SRVEEAAVASVRPAMTPYSGAGAGSCVTRSPSLASVDPERGLGIPDWGSQPPSEWARSTGGEAYVVASARQVISEAEVFAYLLDRGLVTRSAVVSGEVRVVDVSRRNRNFRVVGSGGLSLLVKQGLIRDGFSSIEREARAYRLLGGLAPSARAGSVFPYAPRALAYDTNRDVLILEFLVAAPTVRRVHLTRRPP